MTCHELQERIDRGDIDESTAETHFAECPSCREHRAALSALLKPRLALPSSIPPSRDLWPDIRARVEAPAPGEAPALAVAATIIAMLAGAILTIVSEGPSRQIPGESAAVPEATRTVPREALLTLQASLLPTRDALVSLAHRRQPGELGLRSFEAAAAPLEATLREDPNNVDAHLQLASVYRKEIRYLRRIVR